MKITASQLRQIIKEEVRRTLRESSFGENPYVMIADMTAKTKKAEFEAAGEEVEPGDLEGAISNAISSEFARAVRNQEMSAEVVRKHIDQAIAAATDAGVNPLGLGDHFEYLALINKNYSKSP